MDFRHYSNRLSEATRGIAAVVFIAGMLLIGFGILIYSLPKLFALIMAVLFALAGFSCISLAIKIFCTAGRMKSNGQEGTTVYRKNVEIHYNDDEPGGQ
jgi:hypothetical protein